MKKLVASIIAMTIVAGVAAPAFAWEAKSCPFTDKSMCGTQSISPTMGDSETAD